LEKIKFALLNNAYLKLNRKGVLTMKIAAYLRVSTHEQAEEGYSIAAQKNRLEAYALSQGWDIIRWYIDEGQSAKDLNRTDLTRMLKDIKLGIFECVLVYRLDRLTRSVMDLYKLLNTFDQHNVKFKSATEVYDTTTAIGRLFITLVSALAQWERENLGERVSMGMQQKAREGLWTVSNAPMGYAANDGILTINPTESAIVKEIYSLYLSGLGMWKIATELNQRRIYPRSGKPWVTPSISYILKNPVYMGTTRYNYRVNTDQYFETKGGSPQIVTDDEFNLVQKMMKQRNAAHPRQATSKYIFSKVLKCARCGITLIGKTNTTKRGDKKYISHNYYCPNRLRGLCDLPSISQNLLEQKFVEIIKNWNFRESANEMMEEEENEDKKDYAESIRKLEDELKLIEKRRDKWQFAWANEMITDVDLKKRMNEENEKEKMIQKELNHLTPSESSTVDNSIIEIITNLQLQWEYMTDETKKQFVLISIQSMKIDKVKSDKTPDSICIQEINFN
jgi:site-specific DNA recombinase